MYRTLLLAVAMTLLLSLVGLARAEMPKRVFILHSYELEHVCGKPQHEGIVFGLAEGGWIAGNTVKFETYEMDTKHTHATAGLMDQQAQLALERVRAFAPDLLVTIDDNAFKGVAMQLVDAELPIVFSGMNNQPEKYNTIQPWLASRTTPGHNITGVYEKIHFLTAVKVQQHILPNMNKILVLSDNSPTGKAIVRQIHLELERDPLPIEIEFFITDSLAEYRRAVLAANDSDTDSLYPVALCLKGDDSTIHTASDILTWTVAHATKPSIPLNFAFVRLGLMGGAGVDFFAMGRQAGIKASMILSGVPAGDIPVEDARRYALVFNLGRTLELGINIPNDILMAADEVYR